MGADLLKTFLEKATASGTRSNALTDLRWFCAFLLSAIVAAFRFNAPKWGSVILFIILILAAVLYMAIYLYFMFTNPDALRSERFTLSKMVIEKSLAGDDLFGLVETSNAPALAEDAETADGDEVNSD